MREVTIKARTKRRRSPSSSTHESGCTCTDCHIKQLKQKEDKAKEDGILLMMELVIEIIKLVIELWCFLKERGFLGRKEEKVEVKILPLKEGKESEEGERGEEGGRRGIIIVIKHTPLNTHRLRINFFFG